MTEMTCSCTSRLGALVGALMAMLMVMVSIGCSSTIEAKVPPGQDPDHGQAVTEQWATIVMNLDAPLSERDATPCHRGDPVCLQSVIAEMEARIRLQPCSHTAPFAFMYLEMTRAVAEQQPRFADQAQVAMLDARFAELYFDAFDNWSSNNREDVPAAWQIAFATADREAGSAALDMLLGMNAHISRDLAYVVASSIADDAAGIAADPEGFALVNEVIASIKSPMLQRAAERFDPGIFLLDAEIPAAEAPDPVALITEWRALAFENGIALASATTVDERAAVIAEIERTAAAAAAVLVAAEATNGVEEVAGAIAGRQQGNRAFLNRLERRAHCEQRN